MPSQRKRDVKAAEKVSEKEAKSLKTQTDEPAQAKPAMTVQERIAENKRKAAEKQAEALKAFKNPNMVAGINALFAAKKKEDGDSEED